MDVREMGWNKKNAIPGINLLSERSGVSGFIGVQIELLTSHPYSPADSPALSLIRSRASHILSLLIIIPPFT